MELERFAILSDIHGNSLALEAVLQDIRERDESIMDRKFSLLLCGHTHIPRTVALPDRSLVVNPGSVGLPAYTEDTPGFHRV